MAAMGRALVIAAILVAPACHDFSPDGGSTPDAGITHLCDVDTDCGAHEICAPREDAVRDCSCAAGYSGGAGACSWSGVIADPGFQDAGSWTVANGALIDSSAIDGFGEALLDPGLARFDATALCGWGVVSQVIEMPPYDRAEPLVIEITHRDSDPLLGFIQAAPAIGFGTAWQSFSRSRTFRTDRRCLGAAAYGGAIELAIGPASRECGDSELVIDRVEIGVAEPGECPTPGAVTNGDAEGVDGWSFVTGTNNVGHIIEGIGENGSRAAEIRALRTCSSASMAIEISALDAPESRPALSLWWSQSEPIDQRLVLGNQTFASLDPTKPGQTVTWCLPRYAAGISAPLLARRSGGGGVCDQPVDTRMQLDSVALVDDPNCPSIAEQGEAGLPDPGFETAPRPRPFTSGYPGLTDIVALADPQAARTGNGVLRMRSQAECLTTSFRIPIVAPPAPSGEGPALTFFYRQPDSTNSAATVRSASSTFTLATAVEWTAAHVCLEPGMGKRPQDVTFVINGGPGTCDKVADFDESAFIDDLAVTTLPDCAPAP